MFLSSRPNKCLHRSSRTLKWNALRNLRSATPNCQEESSRRQTHQGRWCSLRCRVHSRWKDQDRLRPFHLGHGWIRCRSHRRLRVEEVPPKFWELPTTSGDHCTGDGHKITISIGTSAIDIEKIQVHPTGLVDPNEPGVKVKFLAAEVLRGVDGLLLNSEDKRFVDELQQCDYVTGKIWEQKGKVCPVFYRSLRHQLIVLYLAPGPHRSQRGSSSLGCVVFGRVSGDSAVIDQHVRDQRAACVECPADSQVSAEFLEKVRVVNTDVQCRPQWSSYFIFYSLA